MEILPVEAELLHADAQADGYTEGRRERWIDERTGRHDNARGTGLM
jgi:hypothetical protein